MSKQIGTGTFMVGDQEYTRTYISDEAYVFTGAGMIRLSFGALPSGTVLYKLDADTRALYSPICDPAPPRGYKTQCRRLLNRSVACLDTVRIIAILAGV